MAERKFWFDFAFGQNWINQLKREYIRQHPRSEGKVTHKIYEYGWEYLYYAIKPFSETSLRGVWTTRDTNLHEVEQNNNEEYDLIR